MRAPIALALFLAVGCDAGKKAPPPAAAPAKPVVVPVDAEVVDPELPHFEGATRVAAKPVMCGGYPCSLQSDTGGERIIGDFETSKKLVGDPQIDFTRQVLAVVHEGHHGVDARRIASWWRRGDTLLLDVVLTHECNATPGSKDADPTPYIVEAAGVTKLDRVERRKSPSGCADPTGPDAGSSGR
jgi:hypothetical protein